MSDRTENTRFDGGFTWPAVALLGLASTAYFGNDQPFRHSRPPTTATGVAEARLWTDPLGGHGKPRRRKLDERAELVDQVLIITVNPSEQQSRVENRRRIRYALHAAASSHRFEPVLSGTTAHVQLDHPSSVTRPIRRVAEASAGTAFVHNQVTNDARFQVDEFVNEHGHRILAVWFPDRAEDDPFRLLDFRCSLQDRPATRHAEYVLVGPSTTDTLRSLELGDLRVLSPWVTGTSLDGNGTASPAPATAERESLICRDRLLADTLYEELQRRGVGRPHETLLILERDSAFARSWHDHLHHAAKDYHRQHGGKVDRFLVSHYSRGIDAEAGPGASGESGTNESNLLEKPSGRSTLDYLRRLSWTYDRGRFEGVRAIGIFGSDVHDKLFMLQALRPLLPNTVFFTNDLEAFYAHPQELLHTQNLLVAAGNGLTPLPDPAPDRDTSRVDEASGSPDIVVTPFRNSYQTSAYLAFATAIGTDEVPYFPPRGAVFEIGARGPVHLATEPAIVRTPMAWALNGLAMLATFLISGLALWVLRGGLPASQEPGEDNRGWHVGITLVVLLALVTLGMMAFTCEPLAWTRGISAWPTEVLRLQVLSLSLVSAYHMSKTMREPLQALVAAGKVPESLLTILWRLPNAVLRVIGERVATTTADTLRWVCGKPPSSREHANRNPVPERAPRDETLAQAHRRFMVHSAILAGVALGLGFVLLSVMGWPHAPVRGTYTRMLDFVLMGTSGIAMVWLVFLVVEFARIQTDNSDLLTERVGKGELDGELVTTVDALARAGGNGIYAPFIVILILCLARLSHFDNWTWPVGLRLLLLLCVGSVMLAHMRLNRHARDLKDACIRRLKDHIRSRTEPVDRHEFDLRELEAIRHGVLAGPANHPLLRALVIPLSGLGSMSFLQYAHVL